MLDYFLKHHTALNKEVLFVSGFCSVFSETTRVNKNDQHILSIILKNWSTGFDNSIVCLF